jgi:hypothetical protein
VRSGLAGQVTCQFGIAAGGMVEQAGGLSCQVKVEECVDAGALGRDDIRPSPMPRCPDPHRSHALAACSRRRPQRWRSRRPVGCSALSDESVTVSQTPALTVSLTVWAGPGIVLFTAVVELRTHGWRDPTRTSWCASLVVTSSAACCPCATGACLFVRSSQSGVMSASLMGPELEAVQTRVVDRQAAPFLLQSSRGLAPLPAEPDPTGPGVRRRWRPTVRRGTAGRSGTRCGRSMRRASSPRPDRPRRRHLSDTPASPSRRGCRPPCAVP